MLGRLRQLAAEVVRDAAKALGPQVITSKKPADLAALERFLKGHHKYGALRAQIDRLPGFLQSRLGKVGPTPTTNLAAARWMRRQFIVPADKLGSAGTWVPPVAGSLPP